MGQHGACLHVRAYLCFDLVRSKRVHLGRLLLFKLCHRHKQVLRLLLLCQELEGERCREITQVHGAGKGEGLVTTDDMGR